MLERVPLAAGVAGLVLLVLAAGYESAPAAPGAACGSRQRAYTERIDVSSSGEQANRRSYRGPMSDSGRFVAFSSLATNLVPRDRNGVEDVFVRDRLLRTTTRVSVDSTGREANGPSYLPVISGDGRYVGFRSVATNLAPPDGRIEEFYVHDRLTGRTVRVPMPTGDNPARPRTGSRRQVCDRWCVNASDASGGALLVTSSARLALGKRPVGRGVFLRFRRRFVQVSVGRRGPANGTSEGASISNDGTVVSFRSFATNLARHDTNHQPDVFVRDLRTGKTERVSVASSGKQANSYSFRGMISGDGRYVGFRSNASNLVRHDTNKALDVFVHDRVTGKTVRVSVASNGAQAGNRHLPWKTRKIGFMSRPFLSEHGRYVAFDSSARNLVRGDTNGHIDVFRHDRQTGRTIRVSVSAHGWQADGDSRITGISSDGRVIGFMSEAGDLVPHDTNHLRDYFVRVLPPPRDCRR